MDKLNFHKLLGFSCQSSNSRRSSTEGNNEKDPTRDFSAIMAWWQDMAQQNGKSNVKRTSFSTQCLLTGRKISNAQREIAAAIIQSNYRRSMERRNYLRIRDATLVLQSVALAWLLVKKKLPLKELMAKSDHRSLSSRGTILEKFGMYATLMADRHYFVNLKKSATVIQQAARAWIARRHYHGSALCNQIYTADHISAATVIQSFIRGWIFRSVFNQGIRQKEKGFVLSEEDRVGDSQMVAAMTIQRFWKIYCHKTAVSHHQHCAATKIQSQYRGWFRRKSFSSKKRAIKTIQRSFRCLRSRRTFQIYKEESAIIIQSHVRGWMARRQAYREKHLVIRIQSYCRGWLRRKEFLLQKDAAIKIQTVLYFMNTRNTFLSQRKAAIDIQSIVRGEITRKRLLGAFHQHTTSKQSLQGRELKIFLQCVVKLQRWWRDILRTEVKTNSAVVIQSHFRGWIARQMAKREKQHVVLIQSYWKGYLARKYAKSQLVDLRLRMQKSAANVDESSRLINRLIAALSELLSMRSVSGILHTCATLDVATELSQRCCEEIVAAGAIGTLLKLICSVSRSIPDQQVLKHALSTLRNIARYPHLAEVLVESTKCVEVVLLEFLRNKEEGYFIASELLKKLCANETGAKVISKSPALLRRLNTLAEELARKAGTDKRNARNLNVREHADRRRREVVELLKLIANA